MCMSKSISFINARTHVKSNPKAAADWDATGRIGFRV